MKKNMLFIPSKGLIHGYVVPLLTVIFFIVLIGIAVVNIPYTTKQYVGNLIADDIATLQDIFQHIDAQCTIIDFEYQKNPINFLNVKTFVGSEVGPMNLTHPERWEGPYLDDNPTMQEKEYQIVRTKKGYFITPGDGVILPNGKRIGVDIILDENADIEMMMHDPTMLMFEGKALAAPLSIGEYRQREPLAIRRELVEKMA